MLFSSYAVSQPFNKINLHPAVSIVVKFCTEDLINCWELTGKTLIYVSLFFFFLLLFLISYILVYLMLLAKQAAE